MSRQKIGNMIKTSQLYTKIILVINMTKISPLKYTCNKNSGNL